mmetsp:Transcript_31280/g.66564  ORF Transcript_31280/g.66564 Transcript_31280/m.66564 type:complete len:125 (+) Transcript_31280:1342-1716(+)
MRSYLLSTATTTFYFYCQAQNNMCDLKVWKRVEWIGSLLWNDYSQSSERFRLSPSSTELETIRDGWCMHSRASAVHALFGYPFLLLIPSSFIKCSQHRTSPFLLAIILPPPPLVAGRRSAPRWQ